MKTKTWIAMVLLGGGQLGCGAAGDDPGDVTAFETNDESALLLTDPGSLATPIEYGGSEWWSLPWCSGTVSIQNALTTINYIRKTIYILGIPFTFRQFHAGTYANTGSTCVIDYTFKLFRAGATGNQGPADYNSTVRSFKFKSGTTSAAYIGPLSNDVASTESCRYYYASLAGTPAIAFKHKTSSGNWSYPVGIWFYCP